MHQPYFASGFGRVPVALALSAALLAACQEHKGQKAVVLPLAGADESWVVGINNFGVVLGGQTNTSAELSVLWAPRPCPPDCDPPVHDPHLITPAANSVEFRTFISDVLNTGFFLVGGYRISTLPDGLETPLLRRHSLNNPANSFEVLLPQPDGYDSGGAVDANRTGHVVGYAFDSTSGESVAVFWRRTTTFGSTYEAIVLNAELPVAISDDGPVLALGVDGVVVIPDPLADPDVVVALPATFVPAGIGQTDPDTGEGGIRVVGSTAVGGVTRPVIIPDPLGSPETVFEIDAADFSVAINVDSNDIILLAPQTFLGDGDVGLAGFGADLSSEAGCSHGPGLVGFCAAENHVLPPANFFIADARGLGARGEVAVTLVDETTGDQRAGLVYALRSVFTLSPFTFPFGPVEVGDTATHTFTITNAGSADGVVYDVGLFTPSAVFSLTTPALPAAVPSGGTLTFDLHFTPNAVSPPNFSTSFSITTDDLVQPNLSGGAVGSGIPATAQPNIVLSIDPETFGPVLLGSIRSATVTILNDGEADLTVTDISLVEEGIGFGLSGLPTLPLTLAPGASSTFTAGFAPFERDSQVTTVRIISNDPDQPESAVVLTGDGVGPDIDVGFLPDLGDLVNGQEARAGIEVDNTGNADLNLFSIDLFSDQADVSVEGTIPATIEPGLSAAFEVVIVPTALGPLAVSVEIDNDTFGSELYVFELSGTVVAAAPDIAVSPLSVDFTPPVISTSETVTQPVTITNEGNDDLVITSIGVLSQHFRVEGVPALPATLAPGGFINLDAVFAPRAAGAFGTAIEITSNDPDESEVFVSLSGTAVAPNVVLSIDPETFGPVLLGSIRSATVTILNDGEADLTVTDISLTDAGIGFGLSGLPTLPLTLAPGASATFSAGFAPFERDSQVTTVRIISNDPDQPESAVVLTGDGVGPDIDVGFVPDLGDLVNGQEARAGIEVDNTGNADLNLFSIDLFSDQAGVSIEGTIPATIEPGLSAAFEVVIVPTTLGPLAVSVEIDNDTFGSERYVLELSGTVVEPQPAIGTTPDVIAFDPVPVGGQGREVLRISNAGNATLTISELALSPDSDAEFSLVGVPTLPALLVPGSFVDVDVLFDPGQSTELKGATVVIASDDPDESAKRVPVTANGSAPNIAVTPMQLDVEVRAGDVATRTLTIANTGNADLMVAGIAAFFDRTDARIQGASEGFTLAPGASRSVTVEFATPVDFVGTDAGEIEIRSNDPDTPTLVVAVSVQATTFPGNPGPGGGGMRPCNSVGGTVDPVLALLWLGFLARAVRRRRE